MSPCNRFDRVLRLHWPLRVAAAVLVLSGFAAYVGGAASGIMQNGTLHFNDWDLNSGGVTAPWVGDQGVLDTDGTFVSSLNDEIVQAVSVGEGSQRYSYSRPVNISVVWIIRVK